MDVFVPNLMIDFKWSTYPRGNDQNIWALETTYILSKLSVIASFCAT